MALPWTNPRRVAEGVATFQMLFSAEIHIVVGWSTAKLGFGAFVIDMTEACERFRESWDDIRAVLKGKPCIYKTNHLSVNQERVFRPVLKDRKPNFYGATDSPQSSVLTELGLRLWRY